MGLLDNVRSAVDDVTGNPSGGSSQSFPKTLKSTHFLSGDVAVTAGEYHKLGEFIVPAQEAYRWGKGAAKYEANQGYLYINILDTATTPAAINGAVRLQQRDAQERNIVTVFEEEAEVLGGSKSDRSMKQALPEQQEYPKVGHQSKLVVAFNPDRDATVNATETEMLLPVTVYPR